MSKLAMEKLPLGNADADLGSVPWAVNAGPEVEAFRAAMRRAVGGVTVISTRHDGRPWGMTVSAFTPVCMDPPTLLVCVNNRTVTAADITRDGRFAVNLLSQAQLFLSQFCARSGEDKFIDDHTIPALELPNRVEMPVLRDSLVTFDCTVKEALPVGSHLVVIAAVKAVLAPAARPPLLYGEGRYLHGVPIEEAKG